MSKNIKKDFPEIEFEVDEDSALIYVPYFREYGIKILDGGSSFQQIHFCPWTGKKLPESLRDKWFDELEKLGYDDPFEQDIPEEFNSDKWWSAKK